MYISSLVARNMNITVYAETSASSKVTAEIAAELHEFRVSVRRGRISLDVAGPRPGMAGGMAGDRAGKIWGKTWGKTWGNLGNLWKSSEKDREELDFPNFKGHFGTILAWNLTKWDLP